MTAFRKFDRVAWYFDQAQECRQRADASATHPERDRWLELAESWEFLGKLQSAPCFCGRSSIGYKCLENGEKIPACSDHLRELIVWNALKGIGLKKPN